MKNRATVLCCAAACAALTVLPVPAQAQVNARRDPFGDALQYLLPASAAGLAWYEGDREGMKELAYTLALSQGSTEALKHVVRSRRPDGSGLGFPSGHTSVAFASAAFVHQRYGLEKSLPFYGLATLTAYSRVHTHHHFTKDVLAGAGIGVGSALLLTHPQERQGGVAVGYGPEGAWVQYAHNW